MATTSSLEIETANIKFANNLLLMLQQEDSRLSGTCSTGTYTGSKTAAPVDYLAPTSFEVADTRGMDLDSRYAQFQQRWVSPTPFHHWVDVDSFDLLLTGIQPQGKIIQNILAAANRKKDDVIIQAFFAAATIGGVGVTTTETFNSGANFPVSVDVADTVGVGAETGLNVEKFLAAQEILGLYENMPETPMHIGMTPGGLRGLMSQTQFTSTDFRNQATFDATGRPRTFLNTTFHYSNRWAYTPADTDERWLPMWMQEGMHLGMWSDIETVISRVNTKAGYPWRAYSMMTLGATRLQAGQVVRIKVLDANGGPIVP